MNPYEPCHVAYILHYRAFVKIQNIMLSGIRVDAPLLKCISLMQMMNGMVSLKCKTPTNNSWLDPSMMMNQVMNPPSSLKHIKVKANSWGR